MVRSAAFRVKKGWFVVVEDSTFHAGAISSVSANASDLMSPNVNESQLYFLDSSPPLSLLPSQNALKS
jgi:hypothetical protein